MRMTQGRHRLLAVLAGASAWLWTIAAPAISWAQTNGDSDAAPPDARVFGYAAKVQLPKPGGEGLCWVLLVVLCLVTVGVLFKNARRSHLD